MRASHKLSIAVFLIATAFTIYLAKGNLDFIPNWVLLLVMCAAGIYWLVNEPSVREIIVYEFKSSTGVLVHPSTLEPLRRPHFAKKRALVMVVVVMGASIGIGSGLWIYRVQQLAQYAKAQVVFQRPENQVGIPFIASSPVRVKEVVTNNGPETARSFRWDVHLTIIELPPTSQTEDRVWRDYITVLRDPGTVEHDLGVGDFRWYTTETPILSTDDAINLRNGTYHLYLTGVARYRDSTALDFTRACFKNTSGA